MDSRTRIRQRAWRSQRAVSDVVATILLLALTVVLFASIFAFVTSFPGPPPQNSNQFQAQLVTGPNTSSGAPAGATEVTAITITHLSGPSVPTFAQIYLKSSLYPNAPEFSTPYSLVDGGIPANHVWNLGETWTLSSNFTGGFHPTLPDNITVYIVSVNTLLFSVILPGQLIDVPPTFLAVGTTPSVPVVGGGFTIYAQIQGVITGDTVVVTLSGLPGLGSVIVAQPMNYSATTGLWTTSVPTGKTTASGDYYVFISATIPLTSLHSARTSTSAVRVTITPYTTLIGNAFSMGSVPTTGTCAAGSSQAVPPIATTTGGCKAGDFIFTVTIHTSSVTFGSVLFQVRVASNNSIYTGGPTASFAILSSSNVVAADTIPGYSMNMNTTWSGFNGGLSPAITSSSALTSTYTIVIDVGSAAPPTPTLTLVAVGAGSYSGSTSITL